MKKILYLAAVLLLTVSCTQRNDKIRIYTLKGDGDLTVQVTNFGARVVSMSAPDRNGIKDNLVEGHDNIQDYIDAKGNRFYGACVGPVANRIGGASFEIDGVRYETPKNDNGVNTLHGGDKGLDMLKWDVLQVQPDRIVMRLIHPDGLEGYPGNIEITATYAVKGNVFSIDYLAKTDKTTPVSIAYHPFFNLRGAGCGPLKGHVLQINADYYEPVDSLLIPYGDFAKVDGTPYDFRQGRKIDSLIYDNNWKINKLNPSGVEFLCSLYEPLSGRRLEIWSDQPGLQVYTGETSIVLEAQHHPDAVNHPDTFGDITINPHMAYTQHTEFHFSVGE